MNVDGGDENVAQLEMFEMIELLWSLCEVLFIDIIPGESSYNFNCSY